MFTLFQDMIERAWMMLNNDLLECDKPTSSDEIDELIFSESNLEGYSDFYKDSEESKVWWIDKIDVKGEFLFSFDQQKIYNLFLDYPHNMMEEEVRIFESENPFWRDFFSDRKLWTICFDWDFFCYQGPFKGSFLWPF